MSAIGSISRQLVSQSLTASGNINIDTDQVLCDATAGAITATLYTSPGDGALHQVVVQKTDSTTSAVTVTDGTFTFPLASQYDSVICQLNASGAWIGISGFDPSGTGDVEGPSSATDNAIARFDATTGKIIQNSAVTVADTTGVIAGTQGVTFSGSTSGTTALVPTAIAGTTTITLPATTGTVALAAATLRAEVTADVTNATATMANLTDLSVTLAAAGIYVGEMIVKCSDSTAAEGIAFDFDGGAATMTAFAAGAGVLTGGTSVASVTTSTAIATDLVWTTITNETWITIRFGFTVNAGGTLIPRFAQGTAHTSGTATVSRGSYLLLFKV